MKPYSNVNELIKSVEDYFGLKVIDGQKENKYWVSVLEGNIFFKKDKDTEEIKSYQMGCLRIKTMMPM